MKKLMVAGMRSGCGKTTVTLGLTALLQDMGFSLQLYKTGPDYIDPMFHSVLSGRPCINLDPWFLDSAGLKKAFFGNASGADFLLVEAAMGLTDGISGEGERGSALQVAEALSLPVLLLVDRGQEAEARLYLDTLPAGRVRGILLNEGGAGHADRAAAADAGGRESERAALPREIAGIPVLGLLPEIPGAALKSRHLGLTVPEDGTEIVRRALLTGRALRGCLDSAELLKLAAGEESYRIAIARDEAFSFFYEENLRLLRECGAEPVFFSPLRDSSLPAGVSGLWLPGGYPELYAEALSANEAMRGDIQDSVRGGLPVVAECGGFMYLMEELESAGGAFWPMCAVLSGRAFRTEKLQRFGYIELEAKCDTLLLKKGERLRSHEFHYWDAEQPGTSVHAEKANGSRSWECVVGSKSMFAGYPHIYLAAFPAAAEHLSEACREFCRQRGRGR